MFREMMRWALLASLFFGCAPAGQPAIGGQPGEVGLRSSALEGDDGGAPPVVGGFFGQSNAANLAKNDFAMIRAHTGIADHVELRTVEPTGDMNGKNLYRTWQRGSGWELFERARDQMIGVAPESFIVWIQGEADANVETRALAYPTSLRTLIYDFEEDTGFHGLWFIVKLNGEYSRGDYGDLVEAAEREVARESTTCGGNTPGRIVLINADDLTIENGLYDGVHYVYKDGRVALSQLIEKKLAEYYGW